MKVEFLMAGVVCESEEKIQSMTYKYLASWLGTRILKVDKQLLACPLVDEATSAVVHFLFLPRSTSR
jgi:hypothetical protein